MALLDTEQVTRDLNKRFAAPLPEFYDRRIIFWKDEDREFEDKIPDIELDNAEIVSLTGNNSFKVKKLLTADDTNHNYLVYCPIAVPEEENYLLPVELYSEEFRADLISIWMNEMHLNDSAALRRSVREYRDFFKKKERREKIAMQNTPVQSPGQLHLAVMAALCGLKDASPNAIFRAVLSSGIDQESNEIYQKFVDYGASEAFWMMTAQTTGYRDTDRDLERLAIHILLTALTRTLSSDYLTGLDSFISIPHQAYCYDFVTDWLHSDKNSSFYEIAIHVEKTARLERRFARVPVMELSEIEIFPCVNENILTSLMTDIGNQIINVELIDAVVEKRRSMVWFDQTEDFFEGVYQTARMQAFYLEHAAGFHTVEPWKVWKEYTSDYYRMDTYYRKFQCAFIHSLTYSNPRLDDLFKQVSDQVEGLYDTWFLDNLGNNWTTASEDDLADRGYIREIPRQTDFYKDLIKPADKRIFVIISDALRYEVAVSLADRLRRETRAEVELDSFSAIFPSVTKYGMAALLPHEKLSIIEKKNGLAVYADDTSTEAGYRDSILKKANPASIALKYKDIILMKRQERSALAKGKEVVYIYHDKIDEMGHTDETLVLPSCEDAIDEVKNMIRIITNEFSGTNILITADHGFLYTHKPLAEDSKVDKTTPAEDDVEIDRRYLVTRKGTSPEYLLPVKFIEDETLYDAFAARENIRIKKNGGGVNYVHGGVSLQEMVVPVISYHYLRNQSKEYLRNKKKYDTEPVELNLLSASRKISNMIFSLNFYQKDPVGDNREAASYQLTFVNSEGEAVSDTQKIIADKTSVSNEDRTFRCTFNLKPIKFSSSETYKLVISNENGLEAPRREEFTIDIAFASDMFDFL